MKTREQWAEEAIQNIRAMLLNAPDPAGWKLVPVQGTEKMMHAGEDVDRPKTYGKIWEAMNIIPFAGKKFKLRYSKFQAWKVAYRWGAGSRVMEKITAHPTRSSMWQSFFGDKFWDIGGKA
jgi:hypothetical protein